MAQDVSTGKWTGKVTQQRVHGGVYIASLTIARVMKPVLWKGGDSVLCLKWWTYESLSLKICCEEQIITSWGFWWESKPKPSPT